MLVIIVGIILGLYITYPIKKTVKYFLGKIEMPKRSLAILTFITCLLILIPSSVLIYGLTLQCLLILTGFIISQIHWLFLDFESLRNDSKITDILNKDSFRRSFRILIGISIFILTMTWFQSFDPYYITPLLISICYSVFIYKVPKKKKTQIQDVSEEI